MVTDKREILESSIDQLGLTAECEAYLTSMNILALNDFIKKGWLTIRNHPKFNYILFNEVISYLQKNDLLYLMEKQNP
jgi:hypothetical protein